jgi:hypothetical protein
MTAGILPYFQLALGSASGEALPKDRWYSTAKAFRVGREYFFDQVSGFKQLMKFPSLVEDFLLCCNVTAVTPRFSALFNACHGAKALMTAREAWANLQGVFNPSHLYSVWKEDQEISSQDWFLAKSAEIADWTMSVCETHKWVAKIGFVASRAWIETVFNCANLVFVAYNLKTEAAKWATGRIIDPMTGRGQEFTWADKGKSLWTIALAISYLALTILSFAEIWKVQLAYATFFTLAFNAAEVASTIGGHFWERLAFS